MPVWQNGYSIRGSMTLADILPPALMILMEDEAFCVELPCSPEG